ncbi:unnamed protein product [Adineta steineri]|uniref:Carrier domain-containing protein n=1 Tax=Adineta steineri TaxID=433720 RepID=A0A819M3F0_9BILA|nr:unnamed protein product [Adineta steineri]
MIPDENYNKEIITKYDVLVIGFHHVAIDQSSVSIFLHDLCNIYNSDMIWLNDDESLQYIDYSVHERLIDMTLSREFWRSQLNGYNQECRLSLPVDRHCLYSDQRSGYASIAHISFDNEISISFLDYAASHEITPFQLCLAIFYAFLFKLTYRQNDLCISCLNANRYRTELQNMVGMFVSTLPYRIQVDSDWAFDELVEHVREKCLSILEHSHYPLQHILTDSQLKQPNISFLETAFNFITVSENNQWSINTATLQQLPMQQSYRAAKFDFALTTLYNPTSEDIKLSYYLTCSRDLFNETTAIVVAQRLKYLVDQLFSSKPISDEINPGLTSISKLSLILPTEAQETKDAFFRRQQNIVNKAPASFAQARIWLDERIRFDPDKPQTAIYNMPFVYRLQSGHTLSIKQLHQSLQYIVEKHPSLHTSLYFDIEKNLLMQRIIARKDNYTDTFSFIETTYETDQQLNEILHDEKRNPHLFDLDQGLVFRYHIIYYQQISSNHLLSDQDILIFNFHHALFDFPSMEVFLHDLNQAYTTGQLLYDDNTNLRYLNYAVIEQQMSMTGASMFWLDVLHDCKLDQPLSLPFDRFRLSNEHRTGRGTSISFDFSPDLLHHFLTHVSSNNMTIEHLTYAIYFIFLFKLTSGQTDLCIAMNINNNRYRDELKSIIGLFENVIPLSCQLDPHWCFHQLFEHVQEITAQSMKYSYFPLQRILDQHPHISKYAFLDTSLEFITYKNNNTAMIGDSQLVSGSSSFNINENEILSVSDFSLSIYHDMNMNQLSCTINASVDLFNAETIFIIAQRLQTMLHQQFTFLNSQINKPMYELSLTLSNEQYLMQSLNNTQTTFSSSHTCIHHEFVCQVMKHPQKLAVELDEQSLTYCELLYYVQVLSLTLLNEYHVLPGEIVCQCVERSLSMVIGIMSIVMAGGVYCSLSPRDPQHRLHAFIQQTESRLVLVHGLTKTKFNNDILSIDIHSILANNDVLSDADFARLSGITVTPNNIVFIIFTSGSTGIPKAIQYRHENFIRFIYSFGNVTTLKDDDLVVQIVRCSYDGHLRQIVGILLIGATCVMLRPRGMTDFEYLANVFYNKQITHFSTIPTLIQSFFSFLMQYKKLYVVKYLRLLCSAGEVFPSKLIDLIQESNIPNCTLWNLYGPAEATIVSTFYRVYSIPNTQSIPIGTPLSNYRCMVINEYSQRSITNQDGELFIGGVGVFAGYLGRDDLTAKALIEIDGQLFYRTGDLVRMDNNGLLHFQGRKDHQIKLHGQRIELGEIERCLLNITSTSACVVIQWNNDHLVAYVQSSDMNEEELRQHCQSHLPPHMVPSIFTMLDKLPLNANGKIDRKLLPPPHFSSIHLTKSIQLLLPTNDIEVSIHLIWCDIFKQNQISTDTNIFTIGGHSLLIMQLFHRYKIEFHLETNTLSISSLFQHPTIIHHAQLIQQSINAIHTVNDYHWSSLHLTQARASFAQERIYLDQQIRFSSNKTTMNNMYVIPLLYRISSMNDHVSITRLHRALQSVITKHNILRTALYIDDTNGNIIQHYLDTNTILNNDYIKSYGFTIINTHIDNRRHMNEIITEILNQADLFDLSTGRVIRFHILRHSQYSQDNTSCENDDLLSENDYILISVHHAMFDGASTSIFLRDLSLAYQSDHSLSVDDNSLEYIDYSVYEHIMDMSLSREFWHYQLERYDIEYSLSLPLDRQRLSTNQQRSGLACIAEIIFDNELCTSFLNYASSQHLTLFQLGLTIFYVFLFRLSRGETDLCISSINANRYRNELQNLIGMFVSTLPYRVEVDSNWSFDELVKHVQEKCLSILEHSHYPLQHILADNRSSQSNVSFLETMFDFITISKDMVQLCLGDANLERISLEQSAEVSKFDFSLNFIYNSSSDDNQMSCHFVCSHDLFEKSTISQIAQRFEYMFEQLFPTLSNNTSMIDMSSSISKLSLILPEEAEEMELVVFHRLENIVNEAPASFAQARIWLDERIRFDPEKPQVAIYNMPFVYRLQSDHTLSIKQLHHALHLTLNKHPSLHTSLYFDIQKNLLIQRVITHEDKNNSNTLSIIETTYETDQQLNEILHDERRNPQLFDLAQGLVFRCHIVYYKQISSDHLLSHKDILIFNFHHALFDFPSMNIFLHDLNQAYTTGQLSYEDNTTLRYIDYAVIEQQMAMTGASMFWLDVLHNCKLDQPLSLPFDRYRLSNEHRTGHGTSVSFDFGQDLSHHFLLHASSNNISLEHLALGTYYVFLFKLTNGEKDLCIGINTHGRYRDELKHIIGMFVNAIPLRCQLDPHLSFHELTKHVEDTTINSMKYSHFPLQRILNQHPNILSPVLLDTSFDFVSSMRRDEEDEIMVGDSRLSLLPYSIKISADEIMSKFDFILSFQHDLNLNEFSCTINASVDLFNVETVCIIGQRLQIMLHQQFTSFDCRTNKALYEISLILSNEQYLMQSLNNTQISFSSCLTCIHHEFVYQVMKHPQKLAVELDEQSLTYCELLYYVQILSLTLLNEYHVFRGEVVCQCVERSLSMVIGIMGIEMAGGVYCPLSPRDPQHRLNALTQQTESRLVLVHDLTETKFDDNIILLNVDSILIVNDLDSDMNYNCLSSVIMKGEGIACTIFTSGSTGIPKAVQLRQQNFINSIAGFVQIDALHEDDVTIQIASATFDAHILEIVGSLICGATIVMLHPQGESMSSAFIKVLMQFVAQSCRIWNLYGPAEATLGTSCQLIDVNSDMHDLPIGKPLPRYICLILNNFSQPIMTQKGGELLVGGLGIFTSYLGRNDLTAKALVEIDGQLFYRTGDLVTMDNNGLLHYQGRKDHQIKLHGQRIELGEIERCLLNITSTSACVVMKWNNDHLVAYVQSSNINEQELREHCQSHLPPHMIPSIFIILDKLPLSQNGKVDRKLLPSPDFSSSIDNIDGNVPQTTLEQQLQDIFSQALHIESPHVEVPFGQLGGTSLGAILALTLIRQQVSNKVDIGLLFTNPSVRQLAQAIEPLLIFGELQETASIVNEIHETDIHRLWNNNTFWLQHILGIPLYNYYLRLCGARISLNTHIYTTIIDTPWLLEIDEGSWIANETYLNCLYFNDDNTFKLNPIRIGSKCSIGARSILFDGVDMQNNIIVQPMSSVTGFIASQTIIDGEEHKFLPSDMSIMQSNKSLSIWYKIYQIIVIISIICIHCTLLILVYKVYSVRQIPLLISIAFCWTLWSIIGCFISLLLLKFIVGSCAAGEIYPIASRLYLQKIWLRQLVVSSFHHAWLLPTGYDYLYPYVLRWLGAHIEENVKLADIEPFLSCPTNLLKLEIGVTSFGGVLIVPTELTLSGDHRVDQIMLGSYTNLANGCSILPGSYLASETMVSNLTRTSQETKSKYREVLMGVPARTMPFQMPSRSKIQDQIEIIPFWHTCLSHYVSKCLLLSIYSFGGLAGGSIIHTMLVCGLHPCRSYIRHQIVQKIIARLRQDHTQFICPFLGNTQWLIRLFRAYGAHIGENVIMPHILSITDYDLMTIGDDVRLNEGTQIQGHSFEQRILKLAPVSIGNSCVLMSGSIVMAGCKLMGNNRLYPGTLIMKNDQLPSNTHWKGVPALLANVALTDQNVLEINCGRGVGAAWCVHTHASPSYIGIDPSQDVINLCERLYSTTPQLSFVVADATKHLPFENESIDIVLCIEATHAFGQPLSITQFANEVARVLRPNGYLLWCDFCYMNGSGTSIYDLIANDELIIEEKINITKNVLHALDIQNKSRTDFIQRYIQPEDQEYFRLFAGLPGTQVYEHMSQGRSEYWRVVFQKKITTNISVT